MAKRYIPEWDGVYPPKIKLLENNSEKSKVILIRERKALAEKCDTIRLCKRNKYCEIFLKLEELDKIIKKQDKKLIREVKKPKRKVKDPIVSMKKINETLKRIHQSRAVFPPFFSFYHCLSILYNRMI